MMFQNFPEKSKPSVNQGQRIQGTSCCVDSWTEKTQFTVASCLGKLPLKEVVSSDVCFFNSYSIAFTVLSLLVDGMGLFS